MSLILDVGGGGVIKGEWWLWGGGAVMAENFNLVTVSFF